MELLARLELVALVGLLALLAVSLVNLRALRKLESYPEPRVWPSVSVLVPARNEEENIEACLSSLLAQDYPDYEVVVLDDGSTDRTWEIIQRMAGANPRLRAYRGKEPPPGWLGKHWACHQLSQEARGELILFTDADTVHHPKALRKGVAALVAEGADLMSALPNEVAKGLGEKLLLPVISFGVHMLPVSLAKRLRAPWLSLTIGQFMLFRKEAYRAVGGHSAVRSHITDDMALGWLIKAEGFRWALADGSGLIRCRMYRGFWRAFRGLSRSIFAAFDFRLLPFLVAFCFLNIVMYSPLVAIGLWLLGSPVPNGLLQLAGVELGLGYLLWLIPYVRFGYGAFWALLYPITFGLLVLAALHSVATAPMGLVRWKGRSLARSHLKLF